MKKLFVSFITTFLLVFMLTSCPGLMSDQTCSVSFCIDGVELAKEINNYGRHARVSVMTVS
ncbi:MAG: hypothetical protein J6Y69_11285 [Treponema sp.]|nr:hypothetical protein [Treponema sp.]